MGVASGRVLQMIVEGSRPCAVWQTDPVKQGGQRHWVAERGARPRGRGGGACFFLRVRQGLGQRQGNPFPSPHPNPPLETLVPAGRLFWNTAQADKPRAGSLGTAGSGAPDSTRYGLPASEDLGALLSNSEPLSEGPGFLVARKALRSLPSGRNHTELRSQTELTDQRTNRQRRRFGPPREATKKPNYPQRQGHCVAMF